jgi:hypothetical protein
LVEIYSRKSGNTRTDTEQTLNEFMNINHTGEFLLSKHA